MDTQRISKCESLLEIVITTYTVTVPIVIVVNINIVVVINIVVIVENLVNICGSITWYFSSILKVISF